MCLNLNFTAALVDIMYQSGWILKTHSVQFASPDGALVECQNGVQGITEQSIAQGCYLPLLSWLLPIKELSSHGLSSNLSQKPQYMCRPSRFWSCKSTIQPLLLMLQFTCMMNVKGQCLLLLCSILNSLREPETGVANCRLS